MSEYRLHKRLGYQLARLAKYVELNLETGLAQQGLTRLQWRVLSGIGIENHNTPSDLAQHVGVSRPGISRTLKTLQSHQLIERLPIGGDGRTRALKLTEKGHAKMSVCWEQAQAAEERLMAKLQPDQVQLLFDTINAMTRGETIELDAKVQRPKTVAMQE